MNTWNNNYVQFQFSAADYTTIRFHTRMGRADGAPPTFRLAYSTDGTTFTNVDTFDVPASGTTNNDLVSAVTQVEWHRIEQRQHGHSLCAASQGSDHTKCHASHVRRTTG